MKCSCLFNRALHITEILHQTLADCSLHHALCHNSFDSALTWSTYQVQNPFRTCPIHQFCSSLVVGLLHVTAVHISVFLLCFFSFSVANQSSFHMQFYQRVGKINTSAGTQTLPFSVQKLRCESCCLTTVIFRAVHLKCARREGDSTPAADTVWYLGGKWREQNKGKETGGKWSESRGGKKEEVSKKNFTPVCGQFSSILGRLVWPWSGTNAQYYCYFLNINLWAVMWTIIILKTFGSITPAGLYFSRFLRSKCGKYALIILNIKNKYAAAS